MGTVKEKIEHLQRNYSPDDTIAIHVWGVVDVILHAKERDIEVTEDRAIEILNSIESGLDSSLGITWDTIEGYTDNFIAEKG